MRLERQRGLEELVRAGFPHFAEDALELEHQRARVAPAWLKQPEQRIGTPALPAPSRGGGRRGNRCVLGQREDVLLGLLLLLKSDVRFEKRAPEKLVQPWVRRGDRRAACGTC